MRLPNAIERKITVASIHWIQCNGKYNPEQIKKVALEFGCSYSTIYREIYKLYHPKQRKVKLSDDKKKDNLKQNAKIYITKRKNNDPVFKFKCLTRSLLYNSFKRACSGKYIKSDRTENLLGCSLDFFIEYISSKFKPEMSIENHGLWHLDHIVPISSANTEADVIKLNHFSNFQPLWAKENFIKSSKLYRHTSTTSQGNVLLLF